MASLLAPERILCGRDIVGIDPASRTVTDARGETMAYERLVLSLPLPTIVSLLVDPPATLIEAAQNLVYTSIYVINVGVEGPPPPWTLLRFPADHVGFYRLSVPSAYAPESAPDGHVALVAEISHHPTRYPVTPGEALEDVRTGLARLGVVPRAERVVVERLTDIRFGHVVWSHRTGASVRLILDYLNSQSIYTCGKYGLWRDMLMTHSMISGIEVARRIDGSRRGASVPAEPLAV
jgi:UDP-galactopyranose mutase